MTASPITLWTLATVAATVALLWAANRFLRPFFWRITLSLIPLVLSGVLVANAAYRYAQGEGGLSFKWGVDLVGGTILVYEVDESKFSGGTANSFNPEELGAALKRRIDPADLYNVTIRPSRTRVEIILPTGGVHEARAAERDWQELVTKIEEKWPPAEGEHYVTEIGKQNALAQLVKKQKQHQDVDLKLIIEEIDRHNKERKEQHKNLPADEIEKVKMLITQVGSLEFRILANTHDDQGAIAAAQKYFADLNSSPDASLQQRYKRDVEEAALLHRPPPPPRPEKGDTFKVQLGKDTFQYTYSWTELGRTERNALGLSNKFATTAADSTTAWSKAAEARKKNEPFLWPMPAGGEILIYSRAVQNARMLPEKDRDTKLFEYFTLTRNSEPGKAVTGDYLVRVEPREQHGQLVVTFGFNQQGGLLFGELTGRNQPEGNFKRYLAIILDGMIESAPSLNARITTEGEISGSFTPESVNNYVRILKAGQLPASLKPTPVSENTMSATLGQDTIMKGTFSVLLAFVSILVFMVLYYRFSGLVACVALLANLLLTIAFMVSVQATFTLPGLAGLVLMLGMAVDANVLIYERLREERDRGASLALSIRNGYDRAFPTIIDTHLSSIFTAIVLYIVGNDQLKGFGISLTVGLIISLFTSLFMTRLLFDLWLAQNWLHKLSMFRFFSRPNIDFMGIRYYWFTATILLTIFGITVFFIRGKEGLNIDFVGGTAYGGKLSQEMSIEELRGLFSEGNISKRLHVEKVEPVSGVDGYVFEITYEGEDKPRRIALPENTTVDLLRERASQLPDYSVEQLYLGYNASNKSDQFTVRTSEKAAELVQASVSRVLEGQLKRIQMDFKIEEPGKRAVLNFLPDQAQPSKESYAYASKNQVQMLLDREFKAAKLKTTIYNLQPPEKAEEDLEKDGRFRTLVLTTNDTIPAEAFKKVLEATQREFRERPQPDRLENFDRQLAKDTQLRALTAILASWGAILLYLWFRFGNWTFGLAAVLCLIHDLFFTMGIIAFAHYIHQAAPGLSNALLLQDFKIDLPSVAALLTLVGYSVNDTIVVFDRIREVRGKNPELTPQMINDSVNQTLSRTLLTSFATWLVVIVLYVAGGEGVHLFAFCMVIGVVVGTYSSIYIASPLLLIFGEGALPPSRVPRQQPVETAV